jgi:amino acid transporter
LHLVFLVTRAGKVLMSVTEPLHAAAASSTSPPTALRKGVISPRQALFFGLTGVSFPLALAGTGGSLSFSSGWSSWLAVLMGSAMALLLGWIVVRFSRRHLTTGSLMAYLTLEIGPKSGAVTGAALFVGYLAAMMLFVSTALVYLVSFLHGFGVTLGGNLLPVLIGLVLIAGCVMLARRGVSLSVNTAVTMGWIGLPVVLAILVAAIAHNGVDLTPQVRLTDFHLSAFTSGVVLAFGVFAGFEGFTALAQETTNPTRTVPKLVVTLLLAIAGASLVSTLLTTPIMMRHADALLAGSSPVSVLADAGGVAPLGVIGDGLIFVATVGALLVYIADAGRIVATAARDGLLPRSIAAVNARYNTPAQAITFVGTLGGAGFAAYILLSGQPLYTAYIAFAVFLSYAWAVAYVALGIAGLIDGLRRKHRLFATASAAATALTAATIIMPLLRGESGALPWIAFAVIGALSVYAIMSLRRDGAATTSETI